MERKVFESNDEILVKQVEGVLKDNNIQYIIKNEGAGSYMNIAYGQSFGLNRVIYVSEDDFEKANKLLEIFNEPSLEYDELPEELKQDEEDLEEEEMTYKKYSIPQKIFKGYILFGFIAIIFTIIFMVIMSVINR